MSTESNEFALTLSLNAGFAQTIDFGMPGVPPFVVDEPAPLGNGSGPNPARLLAASVGSCLAASLMFCMRKAHVEIDGMRTRVEGTLVRNERGRLRIGGLRVRLEPVLALELHDRVPRCLELFEDFCVVTASVRKGIPVDVDVVPVTA
jgi:organic hydroperoxide reductase OsmC/OhrA